MAISNRHLLIQALVELEDEEKARMKLEPWSPRGTGRLPEMNRCDPECPGWFVDGEEHTICRCDECSDGLPDWGFEDDIEAARHALSVLRNQDRIPKPILAAHPCIEAEGCELCLLELVFLAYRAAGEFADLMEEWDAQASRNEYYSIIYRDHDHDAQDFTVVDTPSRTALVCNTCDEEVVHFIKET